MKTKSIVKFAAESVLFLVIIWQIVAFVSGRNGTDTKSMAQASVQMGQTVAAINAAPSNPNAPMSKGEVMKSMADQEARKIIQTGDTEELEKKIEKNSVVLRLLGYDL